MRADNRTDTTTATTVRIPVPLSGTVPAPLLDVANLSLDRATLTIVRVVTDQVSVHDPAGTRLPHGLARPVGLRCLHYLLPVGRPLCRRRLRGTGGHGQADAPVRDRLMPV